MSAAQVRMADALLRTMGGRTVLLHIPAPAIPGDVGEQIGLATPLFQDVPLGPAVLRRIRPKVATFERERTAQNELLVSASAVQKLLGAFDLQSAEVLFAQASGVFIDGELHQVTFVTPVEGFGAVFLYRLGLRSPAASLV